jgi:hypothetical protein
MPYLIVFQLTEEAPTKRHNARVAASERAIQFAKATALTEYADGSRQIPGDVLQPVLDKEHKDRLAARRASEVQLQSELNQIEAHRLRIRGNLSLVRYPTKEAATVAMATAKYEYHDPNAALEYDPAAKCWGVTRDGKWVASGTVKARVEGVAVGYTSDWEGRVRDYHQKGRQGC